jgi:8-oxo-dGTP diphosphatase
MQEAERVLERKENISWLPQPNEGWIILSAQLPPQELIVTAFVLAFDGDRLLQTKLVKRGWDLPGGHVEPGESPAEAARRETYEETGARLGVLHLLGYQHVRLHCPRPPLYNFPYPDSYQVFYWASIESLDSFAPTKETLGRGLFVPDEARQLPWVRRHLGLYEAALSSARWDSTT